MARARFIDGMPVKIRVMRDLIIITPQLTRELFGCIKGMSVTRINKQKVNAWLKKFQARWIILGISRLLSEAEPRAGPEWLNNKKAGNIFRRLILID